MTVKVSSPSMKLVKKGGATAPATHDQEEAVESLTEKAPATVESADTSSAQTIDTGDQIIATAAEIEHLNETKAFKLVPSLLDDIDRNCFRLGGILSRIASMGWFMDKGFENMKQYIDSETDMGYRKARYLIGIYTGLVESGVTWDQVKHLGWTKLKDLAPHLTKENVDDWLLAVNGLTTLQIQDLIKKRTAAVKEGDSAAPAATESPKTTTMTFKLHEDQKATIREALDKCKHETGTEVDTVALENICLDYLGGTSKLKVSLEELMKGKSAEEVLNVFSEVFPDVEISAVLPS